LVTVDHTICVERKFYVFLGKEKNGGYEKKRSRNSLENSSTSLVMRRRERADEGLRGVEDSMKGFGKLFLFVCYYSRHTYIIN